jgi:2'-5' RNA ligase
VTGAGERESLGPSARKHGLAVRAFFAVALGGELRERAAQVARSLAMRPGGDGVRWVAPESYHLTLRFLGNVAAGEIPPLAERAQDALAGCAAFALTLGAPRAFPTPKRPRVVVLAAEPELELGELAARLEKVAVAHGVSPEERAFHPHLTLGRVRSRRMPELAAPAPEGAQPVREVVLFRSDLGRAGVHYTPLATLPLGA